MKNKIREKLRSKLIESGFIEVNNAKWETLEHDVKTAIIPIIEKNKENFGVDSYAVIDAIYEVLDAMFQKK